MSKSKGRHHKSGKAKRRDRSAPPEVGRPPAGADAAAGPDRTAATAAPLPGSRRPAGQRLFDMPYSAQVPSPVRPDLGLRSLVARAGHNAAYDIDVTLLDAADHRLIRTGLLLAHRVLDGRGEWYLGAPDWEPLLPKELIVSMADAELPADLAEVVRPFRRTAPLSPVAALRCERREFSLRDAENRSVALLRDDKVTVRRNGLTTARYREVMLTPVGPGLDEAQAEWLGECFASAGATELERFPRLVRRLGAPATGPSDLPVPADLVGGTFGQFLTQLLGAGVRDLITADLSLSAGAPGAEERLVESAEILRARLLGLRSALGDEWVDDAVEDLSWLAAPPDGPAGEAEPWQRSEARSDALAALGGPGGRDSDGVTGRPLLAGCRARLHSPRYLALLDRLVAAARAPRAASTQPAPEAVASLYGAALERFGRTAGRLSVGGTAQTWEAAWSAAEDLSRATVIRALVDLPQTEKDQGRLGPALDLLERAVGAERAAAQAADGVDELSPSEAFEAGRRYERDRDTVQAVRSDFVARWAKTRRKLG